MLRMTRLNQFDNLNRLTNLVWQVGGNVIAVRPRRQRWKGSTTGR